MIFFTECNAEPRPGDLYPIGENSQPALGTSYCSGPGIFHSSDQGVRYLDTLGVGIIADDEGALHTAGEHSEHYLHFS